MTLCLSDVCINNSMQFDEPSVIHTFNLVQHLLHHVHRYSHTKKIVPISVLAHGLVGYIVVVLIISISVEELLIFYRASIFIPQI